jgi:ubiquinone/menaquinone biosynthesis C-methylase UbiE
MVMPDSRPQMSRPQFLSTVLSVILGCLVLGLGGLTACAAPALVAPAVSSDYQIIAPSADGIGRVYLGREIAQTMGHRGAGWLDRPSRVLQERPQAAIAALDLHPEDVVADLGVGTGYFARRIAPLVPQGKVLAVDIQPEMLALLRDQLQAEGLENVEPILGQPDNPNLPPHSIDLALMVDAYHEFAYPREVMQRVVAALKPGGRVVLVEYRAENPLVLIKPLHKMSVAQVRREMTAVGLEWMKTDDRLPEQHLLFFQRQT